MEKARALLANTDFPAQLVTEQVGYQDQSAFQHNQDHSFRKSPSQHITSFTEKNIMPRTSSTLIGFIAILLWSLLALFTGASVEILPFQLTAMSFALGGMIGVVSWIFRPHAIKELRQSAPVWILGVVGLFGYHFVYFTALKNAPPVEAGLIAYLWPQFIVLFRRLSKVLTDVVTGFCLATSTLALIAHLMTEQTVWPSNSTQWIAVCGLGLGPVGFAFYVWDCGVKHGDIQVLGGASYLAPLLSTLVLILAGYADFTWAVVIAAKEMLSSRKAMD
jgi:drug/metabolite transporter (DMT)-like permease